MKEFASNKLLSLASFSLHTGLTFTAATTRPPTDRFSLTPLFEGVGAGSIAILGEVEAYLPLFSFDASLDSKPVRNDAIT